MGKQEIIKTEILHISLINSVIMSLYASVQDVMEGKEEEEDEWVEIIFNRNKNFLILRFRSKIYKYISI